MNYPPHLPPPTCDREQHAMKERLKLLAVLIFFGVLSGITGAAIFQGWIWQGGVYDTTWLFNRGAVATPPTGRISVAAQERLSGTLFTVYRKSGLVGTVPYLEESDRLGQAVVGLSSGWVVARLPTGSIGNTKEWRLVSANGSIFAADQVINDKELGLTFIHIAKRAGAPSQFKAAVFEEPKIFANASLWQGAGWRNTTVLDIVAWDNSAGHRDSLPLRRYGLTERAADGSVVVNDSGAVVGFVLGNSVVSVSQVARFLPLIESGSKIQYPTLGLEGWFSDERIIASEGERQVGFLVTRVAQPKNSLKRGDVIVEIDGRSMTFENLWYTIPNQEKVTLKVLRAGEQISFTVPVVNF